MLTGQRKELAEAARWLDDDDRHLLGLWWQEAVGELSRAEVAAALTVNPKHAGVRVGRMKTQLEAARAVVRALHASPRCLELTTLIRTWNGQTEPVWRKRLTRHIRDCPTCQRHQQDLLAPEKLLLGLAAVPVAAGSRSRSPYGQRFGLDVGRDPEPVLQEGRRGDGGDGGRSRWRIGLHGPILPGDARRAASGGRPGLDSPSDVDRNDVGRQRLCLTVGLDLPRSRRAGSA